MKLLHELENVSKNSKIKKTFKAPEAVAYPKKYKSMFLAGSIEMDKAKKWQDEVTKKIHALNKNIIVINPRREDWNSSWRQSLDDKNFYEQIDWEHTNITACDFVFIYFQKDTKSPISLLELGLVAGLDKDVVVFCEEGFWRKGNVDYICEQYDILQVNSFDELIEMIEKRIK